MPPVRTSGPNLTRSSPVKVAPSSQNNDVRTSSSTSPPTHPAEVPASAPSRVIRPPQGWIPPRTCNAFFMFRSCRAQQDKANGKAEKQQIMSKSYSEEWADLSDEEKNPYYILFNKADALFKKRFPWYSYAKKQREANKALPRVKINWSPHTDHLFVIDHKGAVVFDTTAVPLPKPAVPLPKPSNVPAPRRVSHTVPHPVKEEDVVMEDAFPPSPVVSPNAVLPYAEEDHTVDPRCRTSRRRRMYRRRESSPDSFEELDAEMDYFDVGRLVPKAIVQSHAMDYEEAGPTYEPFYVTPSVLYEPTEWADFHASPEDKIPNEFDYPDCSDFDDLNLAIYTDEDQKNYYNSYVACD